MEQVNYCQTDGLHLINTELYNRLDRLGLIPNKVRSSNVGKSDYSKHTIQPWSIWIDYELNPWDADIVKRILRTKEEPGMSAVEARIMDYDKIEHICKERKRQLKLEQSSDPYEYVKENYMVPLDSATDTTATYNEILSYLTVADSEPKNLILNNESTAEIIYYLKGNELEKYKNFVEKHKKCGKSVKTCFSHEGGIGTTVTMFCPYCKETEDITDVENW